MNRFIEFKKKRELGEILTDTFAFLRLQFKPFLSTFIKIVGPYLVVMLISMSFYIYFIGNQFDFINEIERSTSQIFITLVIVAIYLISMITVYTLSQSMVLYYVKSYSENNGAIDFDEIKKNVYASFWNFIGLGFLVVISIALGMMCCFFPGIYLLVPLTLSFCILVYNKVSVTEAYQDSFKLVSNEWWMTFATILVLGIIVGVIGFAFGLPAVIYQYLQMGIFSGEVDIENMSSTMRDPIFILFNVIGNLAKFLLNLISIVGGVFIYFNLNEKKNFTGTFERIQNLGRTTED